MGIGLSVWASQLGVELFIAEIPVKKHKASF